LIKVKRSDCATPHGSNGISHKARKSHSGKEQQRDDDKENVCGLSVSLSHSIQSAFDEYKLQNLFAES